MRPLHLALFVCLTLIFPIGWRLLSPPVPLEKAVYADSPELEMMDFFAPRLQMQDSEFLLGGIQINEADNRDWVGSLKEVGMNTVEVTVYAKQSRWNENGLWFAETDPGVIDEIRMAKAAGLRVVLVLRVMLDHSFEANKFLWHGMVFPESEYLLHMWFDWYGRFARQWAKVAEREQVDVFVIGSEMNALSATCQTKAMPDLLEYYLNPLKQKQYREKVEQFREVLQEKDLWVRGYGNYPNPDAYLEEQIKANTDWARKVAFSDSADPLRAINQRRAVLNWYWESLITELRDLYGGKMTFAANFDNYQEVGFWAKLDLIGINAYFPLRDKASSIRDREAFQQTLQNSWEGILKDIRQFSKQMEIPEKPVLFTELGYSNRAGCTMLPWQAHGFSILEDPVKDSLIIWNEQPYEAAERDLATRALYDAVKKQGFPLQGILYWKLTTHDYHLPYEPYALNIASPLRDSLQYSLLRFLDLPQASAR